MKLLIILFFFTLFTQAQMFDSKMIKREILSDILRQETVSKGEVYIITKIDSLNVEHLLKSILEKPYITNFTSPSENLILTADDLSYLANGIRKQYKIEWEDDYFINRKLIKTSAILECLDKDINNEAVMISNPIYFKSDDTICIYFARLCCCSAYGDASLALYKKKNGLWKKSFEIIKEDY